METKICVSIPIQDFHQESPINGFCTRLNLCNRQRGVFNLLMAKISNYEVELRIPFIKTEESTTLRKDMCEGVRETV